MDKTPIYANTEKEFVFTLQELKSSKNVDEILEKNRIALNEAGKRVAFYHFNLSREKAEELLLRKSLIKLIYYCCCCNDEL